METEEVKSEAPKGEQEAPETELPSEQQMLYDLGGSADGVAVDEAATLAELWPSRKPKSDSSTTSVSLSVSHAVLYCELVLGYILLRYFRNQLRPSSNRECSSKDG